MEALLQFGLANAAAAALLAIVVAIVTRFWRNPYLAHVLWAIVLLRLVAPPMLQIPLRTPDWFARQPPANQSPKTPDVVSPEPAAASQDKDAHLTPMSHPAVVPGAKTIDASPGPPARLAVPLSRVDPTSEASAPVPEPSFARTIHFLDVLGGVWIVGTVLYFAITTVRVWRFAHALRRSQCPPSDCLQDEIGDIARSIGLRRPPRLMVVDGPLPPMIWSGWRPTLLVPQRIVESIDPSQRRLLLLHELLHIRRGDHLVRWFVVVVLALYWWNPFAWWAVRRLQNAEEECCDATVLSFQPHDCEIYGEALLAVSEFVSCGSLPAAAVSIGVERKKHLKRRMTMILKGSRWPRLSTGRLAVLIAFGAIALAVSLTTTAAQVEPPSKAATASAANPSGVPLKTTKPASPQADPSSISDSAHPKGLALYDMKPLPTDPTDDTERKLRKERYNAALEAMRAYLSMQQTGNLPSLGEMLAGAKRVRDAEVALHDRPATNDLDPYKTYLAFTKYLEELAEAKRAAGGTTGENVVVESAQTREARIDAELLFKQRQREYWSGSVASPKAGAALPGSSGAAKDVTASGRQSALVTAKPRQPIAFLRDKPVEPLPADDEIQRILKQRYSAAFRALLLYDYQYDVGTTSLGNLLAAARSVLEAKLALAKNSDDQVRARRDYLEFVTIYWRQAKAKLDIGAATGFAPLDEAQAREAMFDAQLKLAQLPSKEKVRAPETIRQVPTEPAGFPEFARSVPPPPVTSGPATAASASKTRPAMLTAKPLQAAAGDDQLQRLLKDRYNSALKSLQSHLVRTEIDRSVPITSVITAARTLLDAELAITAPKDTVGVYQRYLDFMRYFDDFVEKLWNAKTIGTDEFNAVREARLDAEIKLLQARSLSSTNPRADANAGPILQLALQSLETRVRIAEAEVTAARAAVDQSEAEMKRALSNLKYRQAQLGRVQSLRKQNAVSEEVVDEANHAFEEAMAIVDASKASIHAAQAQVAIKAAQLEQVQLDVKQAKGAESK